MSGVECSGVVVVGEDEDVECTGNGFGRVGSGAKRERARRREGRSDIFWVVRDVEGGGMERGEKKVVGGVTSEESEQWDAQGEGTR